MIKLQTKIEGCLSIDSFASLTVIANLSFVCRQPKRRHTVTNRKVDNSKRRHTKDDQKRQRKKNVDKLKLRYTKTWTYHQMHLLYKVAIMICVDNNTANPHELYPIASFLFTSNVLCSHLRLFDVEMTHKLLGSNPVLLNKNIDHWSSNKCCLPASSDVKSCVSYSYQS